MEKVILPLRASHFKGTSFEDNLNCAVATAAKEFFDNPHAGEGVDHLRIGEGYEMHLYAHANYTSVIHEGHSKVAAQANYDDTIIFELELIPYGE